jgi:hypothetical protein
MLPKMANSFATSPSRLGVPSVRHPQNNRITAGVAIFLLVSPQMWSQSAPGAHPPARMQSIGDVIKSADHAGNPQLMSETIGAKEIAVKGRTPIHILYMHGIKQVGAGDSLLLRQGICKYLGECTVTSLGRAYADSGPFALNHAPPELAYMQARIWKTTEDWNASAPFIDRYELAGNGHTPIMLDELNWWPIAYQSTLIVAAIGEILGALDIDDAEDAIRALGILQKQLKYGIVDPDEIALYEVGFADRVVVQVLRPIVSAAAGRNIRAYSKLCTRVAGCTQSVPALFQCLSCEFDLILNANSPGCSTPTSP